jgi:DNA modification methylase
VNYTLIHGDVIDSLRELPSGSVQTVVTSPPYWGLRDYGIPPSVWGGDREHAHEWGDGLRRTGGGRGQGSSSIRLGRANVRAQELVRDQGNVCECGAWRGCLGLEPTPELFVQHIVLVFREVRRVLRDDGTLWVNLGDSYAASAGNTDSFDPKARGRRRNKRPATNGRGEMQPCEDNAVPVTQPNRLRQDGLKTKDLVGIPWMCAFALRADGWYLRADIIWSKLNPMPESVRDRPTKAHEYLFLLAKNERYFYDGDAIREAATWQRENNPDWQYARAATNEIKHPTNRNGKAGGFAEWDASDGRNKRSVWTIATSPFPEAHFATFPPDLVEPCVLAGTSPTACGTCGAPWTRETDISYENPGNRQSNGPQSVARKHKQFGSAGYAQRLEKKTVTTGWAPTCEHDDGSGACVVLDPFSGSGTTGFVALSHQRDYIGIERSAEYLAMSRRRLEGVAPMFATERAHNSTKV